MPFGAGGSLPAQDYWNELAFLLVSNGFIAEGTPVGPETAEGISLVR